MACIQLTAFLAGQSAVAFKWGVADCATLAIGWADEATGGVGLAAWAGHYHDEASCAAFVAGYGGFAALADRHLGRHNGIGRAEAQAVGNIVHCLYGGVEVMGVRSSADMVSLRSARGLVHSRMALVLNEWGVTCRK